MSTLLILVILLAGGPQDAPPQVDLLLDGGRIWTGVADGPWAEWIAIRGEKIVAMGGGGERPTARRRIDLNGRLAVPGFIDSHVHFASAGSLHLGVNLLDVSDDARLRQRIREATARLPRGSWITGGQWGAYEAWSVGSDGKKRGQTRYRPTRAVIDDITPHHPVVITRFDRLLGVANEAALDAFGVESETGVLEGTVLMAALRKVPKKSRARRLAESRRALRECRQWGVTTVHDMSPLDQVDLYRELREKGELTCRIHFSPASLDDVPGMIERGWTIGSGDTWLRFGTIKSHIDGIMGARSARFFEPYDDNASNRKDWRGGWRRFSRDLGNFEDRLLQADKAGIQLRVHAIGDEANSILLDILGRMEKANGKKERRFRLVHAQVFHPKDFKRLKGRGIVAEVQPYHCTDDMRWMEERIGTERCRGAYAFRSLDDAGCILSFGSDWPGTNASYYPLNPILGLYAAVTRQTVKGTPKGGWFPEQRIDLATALRAYTWGSAYASFEEKIKGTLAPGMLADVAVLDTNLFETEPKEWLDAKVDCTIVGGRVVYERKP